MISVSKDSRVIVILIIIFGKGKVEYILTNGSCLLKM